jgi:hypothetical protein
MSDEQLQSLFAGMQRHVENTITESIVASEKRVLGEMAVRMESLENRMDAKMESLETKLLTEFQQVGIAR